MYKSSTSSIGEVSWLVAASESRRRRTGSGRLTELERESQDAVVKNKKLSGKSRGHRVWM